MTSLTGPSFEIRRATVDDDAALQRFIARVYGPGAAPKNTARWFWQFVNNPAKTDSAPSMWLAFQGAEVVAQMGVQDGWLWLDGDRISIGWIVDVMVDMPARGQGLGHALHAEIMKERSFLMTLTMAEATRRIAQKAGCVTLGPTRQFIRPHRLSGATVARYLEYKAQYGKGRRNVIAVFNGTKIGPWAGAVLARIWAGRGGDVDKALRGYEVVSLDQFSGEHDAFWDKCRAGQRAILDRSAEFLNWRFREEPTMRYLRYALYRDGAVAGLLIARHPVPGELPAGIVTDVIAPAGDNVAHDALLALARRELEPGCEFLEAAGSSLDMQAALKRAGFIATYTKRPTIVCTEAEMTERLHGTLDDWHFTKGDHDWDQIHLV